MDILLENLHAYVCASEHISVSHQIFIRAKNVSNKSCQHKLNTHFRPIICLLCLTTFYLIKQRDSFL
jgi:hypothetical protein